MRKMQVVMPYIGKALSVNYYKIVGKGGVKTNRTRPEVTIWMRQLAERVKRFPIHPGDPLVILLHGRFVDDRAPDLSNLHKVIGDAIRDGVGVDDKSFKFVDLGYSIGYPRPVLEITLQGGSSESGTDIPDPGKGGRPTSHSEVG